MQHASAVSPGQAALCMHNIEHIKSLTKPIDLDAVEVVRAAGIIAATACKVLRRNA